MQQERAEWEENLKRLGPAKLVFLDETSINCGMTRLYGRAAKGYRVNDYTPDVRFERTSLISTIRLDGGQAPLIFKGTLTGEFFTEYVEEILAPTLRKGDIVVMDNLKAHKVKGALAAIMDREASVLFLPRYSPDYNPIEQGWSKTKAGLRKERAENGECLEKGLKAALDGITQSDIYGWFKHCGYC